MLKVKNVNELMKASNEKTVIVCGPIESGTKAEDYISGAIAYTYKMHKRPLVGKDQQYPSISGTYWCLMNKSDFGSP